MTTFFKKIPELDVNDTLTADDLLELSQDVAGTQTSTRVNLEDLRDYILSAASNLVTFSHSTVYDIGTIGAALQGLINVKNEPYGALGDGVTDDSAAIQAALTDNDAVFFPSGEYVVDNLEFAGKLLLGNNATLVWKASSATKMLEVTSTDVVINGIKFDGNGTNQALATAAIELAGDRSTIAKCEFTNFRGRVIISTALDMLVVDCNFHDTGTVANCNCVEVTNAGAIVHGNRFTNIGDGHVVRVGYTTVVRSVDSFVLSNNRVKNTLHGTFTCEVGSNRGLIIGNVVDGADAAYKTETDPTVYDITIAYNTVINLTDTGPIDLNSPGVNYIGNRHFNLPNGGPFFGDLGNCEGNYFRDCGIMGVFTVGNRVSFVNNTILDPDTVLAGQIITLQGRCRASGNRIISTTSANLGIGIRVFGANNIVTDNFFDGVSQGIAIASTCTNSVIKDNQVNDCPNQVAEVSIGAGGNVVDGNIGFYGAIPVYTVAAGVITITPRDKAIRIDTEGAAATDDLITINGGVLGQQIVLRSAANARDTTVKDSPASTNISLVGGDFILALSSYRLVLEHDGAGNWVELSRSAP